MEVSKDEEVAQISVHAPHLVILGAGASRAAFPKGDRNGKSLPLMKDFGTCVPISSLFEQHGLSLEDDFEAQFSALVLDAGNKELCSAIEDQVHDYFVGLELPAEPTVYDYLVLSLRRKDVIATFNWDPFLIMSVRRCYRDCSKEPPLLLFLHGNVRSGYCAGCNVIGVTPAVCSRCGRPFSQTPLLYPVGDKDYRSEPGIRKAWELLRQCMASAFWVTVFGYSAPVTDAGAVAIMKNAWGSASKRQFEQFEIIDIRPEQDLVSTWKPFIHTHHYEVHSCFRDSWIANHPRRTGEAYWNQYLEAKWITPNPVPKFDKLDELRDWFQELFDAEDEANNLKA